MPRRLSITIDFDRCLKVFLFLSPVLWLPNITQSGLQMLMLNYGALILFGLSFALPAKREFRNYNILLIFAVCIIVSLFRNFMAYPLNFIPFISGCLLYIAIVRSTEDVRGIIKVLMYLVLVNIIFMVFQLGGLDIVYSEPYILCLFDKCGLMGRNYHLAYFLAFIIPFMFLFGKCGIILSLVSIVAVFMLKSYMGIFSMLLGLLVYAGLRFKKDRVKILIMIGTFLMVSALFVGSHYSQIRHKFTLRKEAFIYIMREAMINPFRGTGIGSFEVDTNLYGENPKFPSSYSQYLRLILELGFIPFLIICWGIFRYFMKIGYACPEFLGSISVILTFGIFHEVLRWARLSIPIIAIVALYEAYCLDKRKELELCQ